MDGYRCYAGHLSCYYKPWKTKQQQKAEVKWTAVVHSTTHDILTPSGEDSMKHNHLLI